MVCIFLRKVNVTAEAKSSSVAWGLGVDAGERGTEQGRAGLAMAKMQVNLKY